MRGGIQFMNTTFTVDGTEYTVTFRHLKTIFPEIFSTAEPDSSYVSRGYNGWEQRLAYSENNGWIP